MQIRAVTQTLLADPSRVAPLRHGLMIDPWQTMTRQRSRHFYGVTDVDSRGTAADGTLPARAARIKHKDPSASISETCTLGNKSGAANYQVGSGLSSSYFAPLVIVLVGQVALLLTSALYQTPSDGNSPLFIYLAIAALSVLLLAPTGPFIHRFTYHVPTFLFLVCLGTVIYNLVAFPFSRDHRLKVYFVQRVNCETGANTVSLTGLDSYVQRIVGELPSAQDQPLNCTTPDVATRKELKTCEWEGLPAKVVPNAAGAAPFGNETNTGRWLEYSIHKGNRSNKATMLVVGLNTRACRIVFDSPISGLAVTGAVSDPRFKPVGAAGSREVRLWHREFGQPWNVGLTWDAEEHAKLSGRVVCLWSDANTGSIPAFDEVQHYLPVWAIPSKISDGLVEGFKRFEI
ncbi:hypothetical protein P3342_009772 [Pyrenophora teres f. teres]|nr:hypothetical protein P3342_009772 [Pyrenophora teres f. teres]